MSINDCAEKVAKASKNTISLVEARQMIVDTEKIIGAERAKGILLGDVDYKALSQKELIVVKKLEDQIAQRRYSKIRNAAKAQEIANRFATSDSGDVMTGVTREAVGIDNHIRMTEAEINGAFLKDIKDEGLTEFYKMRTDPELVAKYTGELTVLDEANKPKLTSIPEAEHEAFKMAEINVKRNKAILARKRSLGAPVGFLEGRSAQNSWDPFKIALNKDNLAERAVKEWDWDKMFIGDMTKEQLVNEFIAKMDSGVHDPSSGRDINYFETLLGTEVKDNMAADIAQRMGKSRKIHIKPEYWHQWQQDFGDGDIYQLMAKDIRNSARSIGMLERLGSEPENIWTTAVSKARQQTRSQGSKGIHPLDEELERKLLYHTLAGHNENPKNYFLARTIGTMRTYLNANLLGAVTQTSLVDPTMQSMRAAAIASSNQLGDQIGSFANHFADLHGKLVGQYGDETARVITAGARELLTDTLAEHMNDMKFADMFSASDMPKTPMERSAYYDFLDKVDGLHRTMLKRTGIETWTTERAANYYSTTGAILGSISHKNFNQLNDGLQAWLKDLQIDDIWDLVRSKAFKDETSGTIYIDPSALKDITAEELLKHRPEAATKRGAENLKNELNTRLQSAFLIDAQSSLSVPDVVTRAQMVGNTQRGTFWGETTRSVMQFKSYPLTFFRKILAPLWVNGKTGVLGAGLTTAMLLNMGIKWMNDLESGKTPTDFTPGSEHSVNNWATLFARTVGVPYFEEFVPKIIAGDTEGIQQAAGALTGPLIAGTVNNVVSGVKAVKAASEGNTDKVAIEALKVGWNLPGVGPLLHGHIMGKTVKNILYGGMMEALDPNYTSKMDKFAEKQGSRYYNLGSDSEQFLSDIANGNQ